MEAGGRSACFAIRTLPRRVFVSPDTSSNVRHALPHRPALPLVVFRRWREQPESLIAAARKKGLHGFALTDHNTSDGCRYLLDKGLMREDGQPVDDFLIIPGVEVTDDGRPPALSRSHAALPERHARPGGLQDWPTRLGGIAIPPHPYDLFPRRHPRGRARYLGNRCARSLQRRDDAEALQPDGLSIRHPARSADDGGQRCASRGGDRHGLHDPAHGRIFP